MEPWELMKEAIKAQANAYAPYTKHAVGAALETDMGVFQGASVENCAYPNSVCAVKAAIVNAVSSGVGSIRSCAVAGYEVERVANICGYCRESLSEFGDMPIYLRAGEKRLVSTVLGDLLPRISSEDPVFAGDLHTAWCDKKRHIGTEDLEFKGFKLDPAQKPLPNDDALNLMNEAIMACKNCYVPVSKYPVGAAVLTKEGIFSGANVENSHIMNATLCAERTAICKAIVHGAKEINALAVVCYKLEDFGRPCGGCRQSLVEFGDYPVYQIKLNVKAKTYTFERQRCFDILPNCFNPECLK